MLKLLRLLKAHQGQVAIVLGLALAQSIGSLLLPRMMSDIVDKGIVKGDQRAIVEHPGGVMLLISLATTACAIAGSFYAAKAATGSGGSCEGRSSRGSSIFRFTSSTGSAPRRWSRAPRTTRRRFSRC